MEFADIVIEMLKIGEELSRRSDELLNNTDLTALDVVRETSELNGERRMFMKIGNMIQEMYEKSKV